MPRGIRKQLTCPACGLIIAEAELQRWPGNLKLTSVKGHEEQPFHVGLLLRLAKQDVASAASERERMEASNRLAFLERNITELIYDLRCPNGHRILRTMPQVAKSMRHTPGNWVSLG